MSDAVKQVGKSGQITLGKAYAGERFAVELQSNGDFLLKRVLMIPAAQVWAYAKEAQADAAAKEAAGLAE